VAVRSSQPDRRGWRPWRAALGRFVPAASIGGRSHRIPGQRAWGGAGRDDQLALSTREC